MDDDPTRQTSSKRRRCLRSNGNESEWPEVEALQLEACIQSMINKGVDRRLKSMLHQMLSPLNNEFEPLEAEQPLHLGFCIQSMINKEMDRRLKSMLHQMSSPLKINQVDDKMGGEVGVGSRTSKLKLCFLDDQIGTDIYTNQHMKLKNGEALQVGLYHVTASSEPCIVETGALSSALIEVVAVKGDFNSINDFDQNIVPQRRGKDKTPFIAGHRFFNLQNGVASLRNLRFTYNSSWVSPDSETNPKMVRLGVRIADQMILEEHSRIEEAVSQPFRVKHGPKNGKKQHLPKERGSSIGGCERVPVNTCDPSTKQFLMGSGQEAGRQHASVLITTVNATVEKHNLLGHEDTRSATHDSNLEPNDQLSLGSMQYLVSTPELGVGMQHASVSISANNSTTEQRHLMSPELGVQRQHASIPITAINSTVKEHNLLGREATKSATHETNLEPNDLLTLGSQYLASSELEVGRQNAYVPIAAISSTIEEHNLLGCEATRSVAFDTNTEPCGLLSLGPVKYPVRAELEMGSQHASISVATMNPTVEEEYLVNPQLGVGKQHASVPITAINSTVEAHNLLECEATRTATHDTNSEPNDLLSLGWKQHMVSSELVVGRQHTPVPITVINSTVEEQNLLGREATGSTVSHYSDIVPNEFSWNDPVFNFIEYLDMDKINSFTSERSNDTS